MKYTFFAFLLALAACRTPPPQHTATQKHHLFALAEKTILAIGEEDGTIEGSSFLVDYRGNRYIVTSFHVASRLEKPMVQDAKGRTFHGRRVLAVDRARDLAILSAEALPTDLDALELGDEYLTSQRIFLIGYPAMGEGEPHLNFEAGFISDHRFEGPEFIGRGRMEYIQFTAPINLGHSGSPLLDERGRVLGVVSWRFDPGGLVQGGNYAVPVRYLQALLEITHHMAGYFGKSPYFCASDADCQWLDYCIEGRCQPLRREGEECSLDSDCLASFRCQRSRCMRPLAAGSWCRDDGDCKSPLVCITGSCRPLGRQGESCLVDKDCQQPLFCSGGVCRRDRSGPNEPCTLAGHCRWPLGCVSGYCQRVEGSACMADVSCAPLFCVQGRCADLGLPGEDCRLDVDCFLPFVCREGKCRPTQSIQELQQSRSFRQQPTLQQTEEYPAPAE